MTKTRTVLLLAALLLLGSLAQPAYSVWQRVAVCDAATLATCLTVGTGGTLSTLAQGAVTTSPPSYTNGTNNVLSLDPQGRQRVLADINNGSATANDASTVAAGTPNVAVTESITRAFDGSTYTRVTGRTAGTKFLLDAALNDGSGNQVGIAAAPLQVSLANTAANATAVKVDGSAVTQPVSPQPTTSGGLTLFRLPAGGSTNATNVKASAGQVYGVQFSNVAAAPRWVHLYNTSGTPTCTTGIQASWMVPANSTAANGAGNNLNFPAGLAFATGIAACITTGNDGSGAVTAGDVVLMVEYK